MPNKISEKNYMSSRIALSVIVTDSSVLGGDLMGPSSATAGSGEVN
jgi:hypothetical protein